MIRRVDGDSLLLITQVDHAELAGRIAEAWGNDRFPIPQPRDAVVSAVACHDAGWSLHDGTPTLNGDHLPAAFYEMPPECHARIWVASVSAAVARGGPMAGLVVSWHFVALARQLPIDDDHEPVRHVIDDFVKAQLLRQRDYCVTCGLSSTLAQERAVPCTPADHAAFYNLNVLRTCDWLSLLLCAKKLPDPLWQIADDLLPGVEKVHAEWHDGKWLRLNPWPLGPPRLRLSVPARRVPDGRYRAANDLQRVYQDARVETVHMELVPG